MSENEAPATSAEISILCHAGWGDGCYPVLGDFDAVGTLVAVHLNLLQHPTLAGTADEQ